MSKLRVMGVDPGTVTTGYGIVDRVPSRVLHVDNGLLMGRKKDPLEFRLAAIFGGLTAILAEARPDVVVVEQVFHGKNARSALILGHARGIILLAAARFGAEVVSYAPAAIKKTVTGSGAANKYQIQMMVKAMLGLPEIPAEDAADALAMAVCHCHHETEVTIRDRISARPRN